MNHSFIVTNPQRLQPTPAPVSKSLGVGAPVTKSLGNPANPQLVQWYEQAYAYYNAVLSGSEAKPDPAKWQDFLNQMQWAASQLGYGGQPGWDPLQGGSAPGAQGGMPGGQLQLPEGAARGPMGNIVWNSERADITCNGGHEVNDIWSNEVNLNIPSLSAKVTAELTQDTRLQPPEDVLKIIVRDPATQAETVYFVHDYQDAKIKINAPTQKQVTDNTDSAGVDLVTWGEYKATDPKDPHAKPDASIPGKVQDDGSIVYEPEFSGGTIDFWANPGENQKHVVYSDANISVKPSDEVTVHKQSNGVIEIVVKHKDQSTDTYLVQKGYKVNVNCNAEYVTFAGKPGTEGVPEELRDRVTLNGGEETDPAKGGASSGEIVDSLLEATGRTEAQLLSALKSAKYPYKSVSDLKKAIEKGEFPGTPNDQLIDFLRILDPDLNKQAKSLSDLIPTGNTSKIKSARDAVQKRLADLVQALMPNAIVSTTTPKNAIGGGLVIDGKTYEWTCGYEGTLIITND
ncbi:MAG: hypothetical protein U1F66_00830 [bacterium]